MGRRRSQKTIKSETKVKEALNTIQDGRIKTEYAAAKEFGASKSTIYRRLSGGKTRAEAREEQQLLSKQEEKALIIWIIMLAATGNPVGHAMVREMAEEIREQRVESINEGLCAGRLSSDRRSLGFAISWTLSLHVNKTISCD